uniref:Lipoprotein n=1 Tax=Strongyloides venezuelensis TaxID=75913 RepID=A0A0K0FKK9_STRVS
MIYLVFIVLLGFFTISCGKSKIYDEKHVEDDDIKSARGKSYHGVSERSVEKSSNNSNPIIERSKSTSSKNSKNFSNNRKKFGNLSKSKLDKTQISGEGRSLALSASQIKVYSEKDPIPDKVKLNRTQKSEKINKGNKNGAEEDTLNNVDTLDDDDYGITKADKEKAKVSISTDVITVFPELYK